VALICRIGGKNLPGGGKKKCSVALICRVVAGKNCHLGKMWHANLKGGNYIAYTIYLPCLFFAKIAKNRTT
jgi:hypothetical protein